MKTFEIEMKLWHFIQKEFFTIPCVLEIIRKMMWAGNIFLFILGGKLIFHHNLCLRFFIWSKWTFINFTFVLNHYCRLHNFKCVNLSHRKRKWCCSCYCIRLYMLLVVIFLLSFTSFFLCSCFISFVVVLVISIFICHFTQYILFRLTKKWMKAAVAAKKKVSVISLTSLWDRP